MHISVIRNNLYKHNKHNDNANDTNNASADKHCRINNNSNWYNSGSQESNATY